MDAPPCDAVGCPEGARWISTVPPPGHFEEYLCDTHMMLLQHHRPDIAASYCEWTVFIARTAPVNAADPLDIEDQNEVAIVIRATRESVAHRARPHRSARMSVPRALADLFRG